MRYLKNKYTAQVMARNVHGENVWVKPDEIVEVADDYGQAKPEAHAVPVVDPHTGEVRARPHTPRPHAGRDTLVHYFDEVKAADYAKQGKAPAVAPVETPKAKPAHSVSQK